MRCLTQHPVIQYKVNSNPALGSGSLSVERVKQNQLVSVIFRNGAKIILHQSLVLPRLSKVYPMKGKNDAVVIETFTLEEGKPVRGIVKCQFQDVKMAEEIIKVIEGIL